MTILRDRQTRRTAASLLATATLVLALAASAIAVWSTGGSGSAAGAAETMPTGATPTARASLDGLVVLTWSAVTLTNGDPVGGYTVQRYSAASGAGATVGAACSGIVTQTTCTESGVGAGTWLYTDTPVLANWTGPPSALSNAVTTGGAPATTTPTLASPTLTVSAPASATVGSAIAPNALGATLVQSAGASASGTIAFTILGPSASAPSICTATGTTLGNTPVSGNGSYTAANGFTPTQAGNYWLYATYSGDTTNTHAQSPCPPTAEITVT